MPRVELRHIRYFIAVAECLNFRKAALRLHIAQPPLSRQIQQLEEELGVELFSRDKRHVELTSAGQAFLEQAIKVMLQTSHATEMARQTYSGNPGIVKVGIGSGLAGVASPAVFEFRKRWPGTGVECRDVFSNFQNEALRRREIDVGFLRPPIDRTMLDCEPLYEEAFVVIVPKYHRLAKRRALRIRDIVNEPILMFSRNYSNTLYDKIVSLYSRHGLTPRVVLENMEPHDEAGAVTVASGKAIFVGAGAFVNRSLAGVELISVPLIEPEARIEVYAAWRKDEDSAAVRGFIDCLRSTLPPQDGKGRVLSSRRLKVKYYRLKSARDVHPRAS